MDNELFGEAHEQEENGLFGKRHQAEDEIDNLKQKSHKIWNTDQEAERIDNNNQRKKGNCK